MHEDRVFNGILVEAATSLRHLESASAVKPTSTGISLPNLQEHVGDAPTRRVPEQGAEKAVPKPATAMDLGYRQIHDVHLWSLNPSGGEGDHFDRSSQDEEGWGFSKQFIEKASGSPRALGWAIDGHQGSHVAFLREIEESILGLRRSGLVEGRPPKAFAVQVGVPGRELRRPRVKGSRK